MSRILVVRLKGGIGNQLFCYATARRLAWANDAELVLDINSGFERDFLYQRKYALSSFNISARIATPSERFEPFGRIRRAIARKVAGSKPISKRRYIHQLGVSYDHTILNLRLQDGVTFFDAFGQSEKYFVDVRDMLQNDLQMSTPSDQYNQNLAKKIALTNSVALHVRWFDTGEGANSSNISTTYYSAAISLLLKKIGQAHFYIFSDKPNDAEEILLPILHNQPYTLVRQNTLDGNSEADFWLMRQCRHFIIGNSTFAWWAAWLAELIDKDTLVIAPSENINPKYSVTAWGFPGLLPDRWLLL